MTFSDAFFLGALRVRLIFQSVVGKLPICDVVKLFDGSLLQELKSECGGIQTLLRNSSQIFQGLLNSGFHDFMITFYQILS